MIKMTKLNYSLLNSPSKKIALVLVLALGVGLSAALSGSSTEQQNSSARHWDTPTARRSQNIEIAPSIQFNNEKAFPTDIAEPNVLPSPTNFTPAPAPPAPSFQLMINACGNQVGNANLRVGNRVIGIISAGTVMDLTGTVSDEWLEVSGAYWPIGADHPTTGTGWVHQCWLTPESMVIADPEPYTEPLGLIRSRHRGRLRQAPSRPHKSYVQSTGELAGYVGRDLYDYALLYPRISAYQSFWNFATEGPQPTYQPYPSISRQYPALPNATQTQPIDVIPSTSIPQITPTVPVVTTPQSCGSVASQFLDWLVDPGPTC